MADKKVNVVIQIGVKGEKDKDRVIKNLEKLGSTASKSGKQASDSLKSITPEMKGLWEQVDKLAQHWGVSFQQALPYVKKLGASFKESATDTYQLAQVADFVSKKFNASFKQTYAVLKNMGVGFEGVSHDVDKAARAARKFAQEWGVSFESAFQSQLRLQRENQAMADSAQKFAKDWGVSYDDAFQYQLRLGTGVKQSSDNIKDSLEKTGKQATVFSQDFGSSLNGINVNFEEILKVAQKFSKDWGIPIQDAITHVKKMGVGMKETENQIGQSSRGIGYQLTFIAWHFRYLGNIFDRVYKSMIRGIRDVIVESAELQESFLSIRTAAIMYGQDAEKANQIVKDLALTGLLPLKEAANSVKNLMITGVGMPQLEKLTYRYLDVAFLFTSDLDEMQKSLQTMSESILRGTTVLATDVTARTIWTATEERLQKTMGVSLKNLSARRRAIEVLKTIEEKYAATLGLHEIQAQTTTGAINRLKVSIELIKNALGTALLPILNSVATAFAKLAVYIEGLIKALGPTIPVMVAVGLAIAFVISKLSFGLGVFLSFYQIMKQLSVMTGGVALSLWKIYLPLIAIGALVGGGVYLFLRYTGALDKAKQSAANIEEQFKKLQDTVTGLNKDTEESIGIDKDKRIAHERTVEDIMEDLERERSKGLWANQMTIKDLEKRLKRENEDWDRYLTGLGNKDVEDPTAGLGGIFGNMLDDANKAAGELGKIDWFGGLKDPNNWAKVRDAILRFTDEITKTVSDPNFWRFFGEELAKNMGNIIVGIGDTIKAAFEGLFGSVMKGVAVVAALTFVTAFGIALIKHFAVGSIGFTAAGTAAASLGTAFTAALLAAIPATIAISLILVTGAALYQAIKFKQDINNIFDTLNRNQENINRLMDIYIQRFKDGKINAEELKRKTDELTSSQKNLATESSKATWSTWKFISGQYLGDAFQSFFKKLGFQSGGIVPGLRNQPVPILAHGGERIIPAGETTGGGNTIININNPSVRSDNDIREIARQVSEALSQRSRWSRMGAY